MNPHTLQRRKQLFNTFSTQLSLLNEKGLINIPLQFEKTYICPICLRQFSEEHLDNNVKNHLTLEDAPPFALGGSKIALTCKECNNTCGYKIDSHLSEILKQIDDSYFYKNTTQHRKFNFEGGILNVELTSMGDGTLSAYHRIKNNNPTRLDKFIHGLKKRNARMALNLEPPGRSKVDPKRVNYALVKTNYIITFAKFGYIFLLNPRYENIRHQLLEPENVHYPWTPFIKDQMAPQNVGTYYVDNPELGSILNIFSLRTQYSETIIAGTLPLPFLSTPEYSARIDAAKNHNDELELVTMSYDADANLFNNWVEIRKVLNWVDSFEQ